MYRGKLKARGAADPSSDLAAYQERLARESARFAAPPAEKSAGKMRALPRFADFFSRLDPENAALVLLVLFLLADREETDFILIGALLYLILGK